MGDSHNKRGKKFSFVQDVAICRAWLFIGQDPLVGNSQGGETFWRRIHSNYQEISEDISRTVGSLQARWGVILKSCNKYRGRISEIENLHPSGMTQADWIVRAKVFYQQNEGKPFVLDHCWDVLKDGVKWQDMFATKSVNMNTSSNLDSPRSQTPNNFLGVDYESTPSVESPRKRPAGIKKEKEAVSRRKTNEALNSRFVIGFEDFNKKWNEARFEKAEREERRTKAMELHAEMERREQERLEKKDEQEIMDKDLSNLDPRRRAFYEMRQNEILEKWSKCQAEGSAFCVPFQDFD